MTEEEGPKEAKDEEAAKEEAAPAGSPKEETPAPEPEKKEGEVKAEEEPKEAPSKEEAKPAEDASPEGDKKPAKDPEVDVIEDAAPVKASDAAEAVKKSLAKEVPSKAYSRYMEDHRTDWEPSTRLGIMVKSGQVTTMSEALRSRQPLKEPEIVDILLPEMDDEVLDVHMVQRMTDSGRRVQFLITCVVGNENGFVGLGTAKGKEVGFTIRKAIENAKVNIIEVKRGCGSWECGCMTPHTFPFAVTGKSGSVVVKFKPSPRGIGLAVGNIAKHILRLAGIKDAWVFTSGQTQTTTNYAKAVFAALNKATEMRITPGLEKNLQIKKGPIEVAE